jgi:hypothetical protein
VSPASALARQDMVSAAATAQSPFSIYGPSGTFFRQ